MPLLKVENVTRHFGGVMAVNDVSLTLSRGEIVGLIGPNGAGKSTLFNLISGVESSPIQAQSDSKTGISLPWHLIRSANTASPGPFSL